MSFVIGALLLFDPAGAAYQVSVWVALAIGLTLALLIGDRDGEGHRRSGGRQPQTGYEELAGDSGVVRQTLDPDGHVFIHGELWKARAAGRPDRRRRDGQGASRSTRDSRSSSARRRGPRGTVARRIG